MEFIQSCDQLGRNGIQETHELCLVHLGVLDEGPSARTPDHHTFLVSEIHNFERVDHILGRYSGNGIGIEPFFVIIGQDGFGKGRVGRFAGLPWGGTAACRSYANGAGDPRIAYIVGGEFFDLIQFAQAFPNFIGRSIDDLGLGHDRIRLLGPALCESREDQRHNDEGFCSFHTAFDLTINGYKVEEKRNR